ncbi:ABC transporter permease [Nocardioides sp. HDW12B]|nr:ABC transporter permease [Nocardioides sp. HDW12B]
MWDYLVDQRTELLYSSYQHVSLVVQCVAIATVLAFLLAVLVTRVPALDPVANAISSIGLTLPSFALIGLLLPLVGIGPRPSVIAVTFYAILPILRNAVVGLQGVSATLLESSRGMGMGSVSTLLRVQLPLAWPVILAGVRTSTQMSMGVAAIAAFALGPGLGGYIYAGLEQIGSANALYSALVGTVGVILLALVLDALLQVFGRVTTSKGIRV